YSNMFFFLIIIMNVTIGIIQEIHAKNLVEDLSIVSSLKVDVVRDATQQEISVDDLVLDDITIVDLGKQICADSVVVEGEVEVNEALLTGESDPMIKKPGDPLLSGSFVVSGKCYAKVEEVGADSFANQLALKAKRHKGIQSELLRSMKKVTKFTSFFIIPIGVALFAQAFFFRMDPMKESVIATAAALLGMLPKGLALLISIALATGVIKLSKKRILVQDLYSVETLAHVDTLCLDKTGTITEGKMSVTGMRTMDTNGAVSLEDAVSLFVGGMEDNNATFLALRERFTPDTSKKVISRTPFSSSRKWSSVTLEGVGSIIVGAPERLSIKARVSLPKEAILDQEAGKRILCVGISPEEIVDGVLPEMKLLGVLTLNDNIRENVKETLEFFRREGVEVKIISGDNPITVSSIAKQAGLATYESYIDLTTIETEEEIEEIAERYTIFGRVSPGQKSQLVHALQKKGHTVAMTGDGVNDVLALKEADCSIAMAAGSDAAKQVAQLVLLDSNFTSLPDVVMEGRRVVNNVTRVAGVFFIKTIYSILLSIYCILTGTAFPFIPIQITLIDLAIEGYPAFFMSFEPVHNRIKGTFLGTSLKRAFPYALTIITSIIAFNLILPSLSIVDNEATTIMYYITGFISVLGVVQSCMPFNKLRVFLVATVSVGYYTAILLFTKILHLDYLDKQMLMTVLAGAVIVIPVLFIYKYIVDQVVKSKVISK
ncbi:MAG TPA: HAD-IC family P-type ATPase, partial [Candidatus Merdenecus merdavium]|nr:HAD-IC family P-type ATPase [Candidatus Merdenecus merdavium]